MVDHTRHNGIFVDCENPDVQHEGVLIIEQGFLPVIEIHDRHRRFSIFPRLPHLSVGRQVGAKIPKVVGQLAADLYVLATDVNVESVTHPSVGTYDTAKLRVHGDLIHSSDEIVWRDEDALADTLHVRMDRLEEWTLSPISVTAPGRYSECSFWFSGGVSVLQDSPEQIAVSRDQPAQTEIGIGDGLSLKIESRLLYGEGERTLHSTNVFQQAVLLVESTQPRPVEELRDVAQTFRTFLRFVYDEECKVRSMKGTRTDRNRDMESIFDEPIPHVHQIYCQYASEPLSAHGKPLFRLEDVVGRPVIETWYGLEEYHRQVLDEMAGGASQLYCASIAASLLGEQANVFKDGSRKSKFTRFMDDLGLDEWGVDTKMWGHRIGFLRNDPMHGRATRLTPDELVATCRVVIQLMKILTLRELGFSRDEMGQLLVGKRWTLAPAEEPN